MSEPFLGELKMISWNFPQKGWAMCNGGTLPINSNQALFSLLGTSYGGDGRTTFGLPDLRGRVPIHQGGGFTLGEVLGEEAHTLIQSEMPDHTHLLLANNATAAQAAFAGAVLASSNNTYTPVDGALTTLRPGTITNIGGSQAHTNMQPYLVINWMIALQGIFPSQT